MNQKTIILLVIFLIIIILIVTRKSQNKLNFDGDISNNNDILPYDVVIVGCARNIDKHLNNTKEKLLMLKSLFKSAKIIIYENDSIDNTLNILKEWEQDNLITLITEKNVPGKRTQRIAHGRNILLKEALKNKFDLLLVIDLDDVIAKLDRNSIRSSFNMTEDWAAVGANQLERYYDLWALRTYDNWMNYDCWECVRKYKKYLNPIATYNCVESKYRNIPQTSKPIQVKSCFGGLTIYKRKYLDGCTYGTGLNKQFNEQNNEEYNEVCEHVLFNQCIINNGGKIYINPKMINS